MIYTIGDLRTTDVTAIVPVAGICRVFYLGRVFGGSCIEGEKQKLKDLHSQGSDPALQQREK
jgi:hypothetical protein